MPTSGTHRIDREDGGFTLIELMVVLLIIAILLAIAIPTFLGARNRANARATQENLRNALTAETTNWTSNQVFATNLAADEPSLNWLTTNTFTAGAAEVYAALYSEQPSGSPASSLNATAGGSIDDGVMLIGLGRDGNCYALYQSNNAVMDFSAYREWAAGTGGTCPTPSPPAGYPASQSAASNPTVWSSYF